jgi:hypothetical protein
MMFDLAREWHAITTSLRQIPMCTVAATNVGAGPSVGLISPGVCYDSSGCCDGQEDANGPDVSTISDHDVVSFKNS